MGRTADQVQFDAFYRANAANVVHLVYAATGDLTVAQDSTQEAFARAWARWSSVSWYDDPLAWVRTVAHRVASSGWRRRSGKHRAYVRHGEPAPAAGPSEDRVAVLAALQKLSEPVRVAVVLHYLADLPVEQIAQETHAPVGTVKARLHRGRAQLADALSTAARDDTEELRRG
ncbi:MAG TPA: sigma-70 family RNA polymerase sigma factor [Dermatophilaceae bacterium]|nr:sigma-70 family RNA polymerase sigma factor [Dermatophilaceae bacterium]